MKPLQMLDVVMLWVARVFALFVTLGTIVHALWAKNGIQFGFEMTAIVVGMCTICFFCTLVPRFFICRLFLSISALLLLVIACEGAFFELRTFQEISVPFGQSLVFMIREYGISLVGLTAILWIAYRPSQNTVNSV